MSKKTITEIITELTGETPVPYSGELKAIRCPFHEDSSPSLVIYHYTDSYYCFPCHFGGDVYNFVAKFKGISYRAAKELLDGNLDKIEEMRMKLDGLDVKDDYDYKKTLNMAVSKYCRDLLYNKPQLVDNILSFLEHLDKNVLTKPVTNDILERVIKESRELDK